MRNSHKNQTKKRKRRNFREGAGMPGGGQSRRGNLKREMKQALRQKTEVVTSQSLALLATITNFKFSFLYIYFSNINISISFNKICPLDKWNY